MAIPETSTALTGKQRWLAAIRCEPVDRLPFWPKLNGSYPPARTGAFAGWNLTQLHAWIGGEQHPGVGAALRERRTRTGSRVERDGDERRIVFETPFGELARTERFDLASQSWHPIRFPLTSRRDVEWLTAWYEDQSWDVDPDALVRVTEQCAAFGDVGVTHVGIGQSALMHSVEWLAGIEQVHYLLADEPEAMAGLYAVYHQRLREKARLLAERHPADVLYLIENTSTTLVSPAQYERWWYADIADVGRDLAAFDRLLILHMCGHLRALLPRLGALPAAGFEAFTAPPLGNTTLLHGRLGCPDKCLIGGTHATLWLEPPERIIAWLAARLDELPHHRGILVTSAGVMPPGCPPETIREVRRWVQSQPVRG